VKKIIALVIAVCVYFFSIRISSRLRRWIWNICKLKTWMFRYN
jgi:hypothetical protein